MDSSNEIIVSVVSAWEIAIKNSLKREKAQLCSSAEFIDEIGLSGFDIIALEPSHIRQVEVLPFHHRDPFDRLLISTAIAENMIFISADENVPRYGVKWLW